MKTELQKLVDFYGDDVEETDDYVRICLQFHETSEALKEELNEKQKKLLEKMLNLELDKECEVEEAFFIAGFKVGMRLAMESYGR